MYCINHGKSPFKAVFWKLLECFSRKKRADGCVRVTPAGGELSGGVAGMQGDALRASAEVTCSSDGEVRGSPGEAVKPLKKNAGLMHSNTKSKEFKYERKKINK